jgi:hypothetical protein
MTHCEYIAWYVVSAGQIGTWNGEAFTLTPVGEAMLALANLPLAIEQDCDDYYTLTHHEPIDA